MTLVLDLSDTNRTVCYSTKLVEVNDRLTAGISFLRRFDLQ